MNESQFAVTRPVESILATNKVLKNTYLLLSMTLIFSAAMGGTIYLHELPTHALDYPARRHVWLINADKCL